MNTSEMEMDLPDPQGEPSPESRDSFGTLIWIAFAGTVAVALMFGPSILGVGQCRGASRSSRIKWQEREAEIDQVIAAEQAVHSRNLNVGNSESVANKTAM